MDGSTRSSQLFGVLTTQCGLDCAASRRKFLDQRCPLRLRQPWIAAAPKPAADNDVSPIRGCQWHGAPLLHHLKSGFMTTLTQPSFLSRKVLYISDRKSVV